MFISVIATIWYPYINEWGSNVGGLLGSICIISIFVVYLLNECHKNRGYSKVNSVLCILCLRDPWNFGLQLVLVLHVGITGRICKTIQSIIRHTSFHHFFNGFKKISRKKRQLWVAYNYLNTSSGIGLLFCIRNYNVKILSKLLCNYYCFGVPIICSFCRHKISFFRVQHISHYKLIYNHRWFRGL